MVHPAERPAAFGQARVEVQLHCTKTQLVAQFEVREQPIRANPAFSTESSQWGLWEWDVVELFVQASAAAPTYYEFQVSPLGQFFELEIFEPRKRFNRDFASGFRAHAKTLSSADWNAELVIPLRAIGWDGDPQSLKGNAFAVLSSTYWSLFLPPQQKPDFHLPQYFKAF